MKILIDTVPILTYASPKKQWTNTVLRYLAQIILTLRPSFLLQICHITFMTDIWFIDRAVTQSRSTNFLRSANFLPRDRTCELRITLDKTSTFSINHIINLHRNHNRLHNMARKCLNHKFSKSEFTCKRESLGFPTAQPLVHLVKYKLERTLLLERTTFTLLKLRGQKYQ